MLWTAKKAFYRILHNTFRHIVPLIKVPMPELLTGAGSVKKLPKVIKEEGLKKVLIVTDKIIVELGLINDLMDALTEQGIQYEIFDDVQPNPSIQNVENGLKFFLDTGCDALIGFGGGSPMDCCKTIGARANNPNISVRKMKGAFKIKKDLPPLFAIPTTAGTGSETTIVAAITNKETHEKFAIASNKLVPKYAILDPELMLGLPPHISAATGMDALTHAVEAYISMYRTPLTDEYAEKAVRIIIKDLEAVFQDGSDVEKRNNMAMASYYAGVSFTRAIVGYVHAIAHNFGGLYGVPHGLANAVTLPYILEYSRADIVAELSKLAVVGGLGKTGESEDELCTRFIEKIKSMNNNMNIPTFIKELQEKDIPLIAKRALKEANPDYPVPTYMNQADCEGVVRKLLPSS